MLSSQGQPMVQEVISAYQTRMTLRVFSMGDLVGSPAMTMKEVIRRRASTQLKGMNSTASS